MPLVWRSCPVTLLLKNSGYPAIYGLLICCTPFSPKTLNMCNHIIPHKVIIMTNVTLAIPEDLHTKMKEHSEIRWSEVVRKTIAEKVEMLEAMDTLAKKSKLTKK